MPGPEESAFNPARITALHDAGHSNHQISEILVIPRSSVVRIVHRYQEFNTVENRPRNRRLRVYSEREDRYLVQYSHRHRTASTSAHMSHFISPLSVRSTPTI